MSKYLVGAWAEGNAEDLSQCLGYCYLRMADEAALVFLKISSLKDAAGILYLVWDTRALIPGEMCLSNTLPLGCASG